VTISWLLLVVVGLAWLTQTITGFGATLVTMTLGSYLMDRGALLSMVVPLGLLQTGFIVFKDRAHIARGLLLRRILPWMGVGLTLGYALSSWAAGPWLLRAFGALVLTLSVVELRKLIGLHGWKTQTLRVEGLPRVAALPSPGWLGVSGVLHGLYATGGPTLVYALSKSDMDRKVFRSTLAVVWLVLDGILTGLFIADGTLTTTRLIDIAALLPALAVGMVAGELMIKRTPERVFRVGLFALLTIAGAALALR
jgi:uncharacterized membrane protein YfcA